VNDTIFADKIEEHRELGEVQRIRQSCGHQEPLPWQHTVQQTWDTQDKVKLKTAAKTELLLNTVKFRLAVSHTVIIGNSIIHEQ